MRDADPAGAVFVLFSFAVPVELHFHAAVLVGVNLFAGGPDDDGGLAALDEGLRRDALRPERYRGRDAFEAVSITQFFTGSTGLIASLRRNVPDRSQQI